MKIKIGQDWGNDIDRDLARVNKLRELAGDAVELMVDANGAYSRAQARRVGAALDHLGVTWFEEPVSSDDTDGLAALRHTVRCDVAAGEYIADRYDARRLAPVVDCLQLDATRCGGYSGWLAAASIAAAHNLDVSAHCAPALHTPVAAAIPHLATSNTSSTTPAWRPNCSTAYRHRPTATHPELSRPGHGITLSPRADQYRHQPD